MVWPDEEFVLAGVTRKNGRVARRAYCSECRRREHRRKLLEALPVAPAVTDLELEVVEGAACKGSPLHGSYRESQHHLHKEELLSVCDLCPVQEKCQAFGDQFESELFSPAQFNRPEFLTGIFGGETPQVRTHRRRKERECQEERNVA